MSSESERVAEENANGKNNHLPVGQPEGHIILADFLEKYGAEDVRLSLSTLQHACRKQFLLAKKQRLPMQIGNRKTKTLVTRWFILDLPPQEHPGWEKFNKFSQNRLLKKSTKAVLKNFDKMAPILLDNYDNRENQDQTLFKLSELSKILTISQETIMYLAMVGIKGYGQIPITKINPKQVQLRAEGGDYTCRDPKWDQRSTVFFEHKDIRRFLRKELLTKKFNLAEDKLKQNNLPEIIASQGYYVYDPDKVHPFTYEGFLAWAKENIVFYDKVSRKIMPFKPSAKQLEFYQKVFLQKSPGLLKYKILGICRPRGDYKTFDAALLVLFRFFNLEKELIYLVTNSVQQTTHLIFKEIITAMKYSPTLSKMLDTPGLDIQKDGIYLRSGRGDENVINSIQIISAEGGARSNATCFAWSEAWKYKGNEVNVAELEQSIRGVDNAWFVVESTVAPKGHFFQRYYKISLDGGDKVLYFQYYDGSQRCNLKIKNDPDYLDFLRKQWGTLYFNMFFGNRWEDAAISVFSKDSIIEIGYLGVHGRVSRDRELIETVSQIVDIGGRVNKLEAGYDVRVLQFEQQQLIKRLNPIEQYYKDQFPAPNDILIELGQIFNCEFIVGIGLDRAKHSESRSMKQTPDRTVQATVARGILDPAIWGTDRIFFLLNLIINTELSFQTILKQLEHDCNMYAGGFAYIDLEDYNAIDLNNELRILFGEESSWIAPISFKHQETIFTELDLALQNGYFKAPHLNIWTDKEDGVIYSPPEKGFEDILRSELSAFEAHAGTNKEGKGRQGYYGSCYKKQTGRTALGEAKDDTVYAIAHAIHASIRGDIPAVLMHTKFPETMINKDVIADYGSYGLKTF